MEDAMARIRVAGFGVSLDGFAAGTEQSLDHPLGKRGPELFQWYFPTRTFREMHGESGGDAGSDDEFARRSMDGFGAFILGRNMFGPIRGEWPDEQWKGWWGDNPPYHAPTFVLTHHPRASIEMDGGTTFHFITDGIEAALQCAREAAGQKDIKIGGDNISAQAMSTRFIWRWRPWCLVRANRCLMASIFAPLDIAPLNTYRPRAPLMSCWHGERLLSGSGK
jgi:dihydrofolate reductase